MFTKFLVTFASQTAPCQDHTDSLLEDLLADDEEDTMDKEKEEKTQLKKCDEDVCENKFKRLYRIDEAPEYVRHNAFILSGYRGLLDTKHCIER